MEITLSNELESKLSQLASLEGRESSSLVIEAIERLLDYDTWFLAQVDKGLAQVACGQTLSHEEAGNRLQTHLTHRLSRV